MQVSAKIYWVAIKTRWNPKQNKKKKNNYFIYFIAFNIVLNANSPNKVALDAGVRLDPHAPRSTHVRKHPAAPFTLLAVEFISWKSFPIPKCGKTKHFRIFGRQLQEQLAWVVNFIS